MWRLRPGTSFLPCALAAGLSLGASAVAHAATFTVDTTADAVDAVPGDGICATAAGTCSLRAAVQEANALAGPDTIDLPAGTYVLMLAGPAEDASASGDLDVHETLTITGAGAAITVIDGNASSRVVEASQPFQGNPRTVTLSGVTVRNGKLQDGDACEGVSTPLGNTTFGGGAGLCANLVSLTLVDSVVESNEGDAGITVFSILTTLTRSTVRDNQGYGIAWIAGGAAITDSTISGNRGGLAVGLDESVEIDIRNSTISGNGETGISAGIVCEEGNTPECIVSARVTLNNVTITGHTGEAVFNGLLFVGGSPSIPGDGTSPVYVSNSVLAGNGTECRGQERTGEGTLRSRGYNLLQTLTDCRVVDDTTGNIVGVPAKLGPLQDNGGPTATHALLPGSPAIDAGNPAPPGSGDAACEAADQRGVPRPSGPRCDMGAYEATCGDGDLDLGEQCDDGNLADGDCCSAVCRLDAPGSPCAGDRDACTDDVCDGAGTCQHVARQCDDGNPCTADSCKRGRGCIHRRLPRCNP
jgi:CSLREA domain-containing protein